jgi:hypothetical protein
MDCLSPSSPVQRVALMKGAQIGGTECGNCWIGYVIHQAPGPMMAVAPTVELAKRNSLDPPARRDPRGRQSSGRHQHFRARLRQLRPGHHDAPAARRLSRRAYRIC